jgi:hypothetical protein
MIPKPANNLAVRDRNGVEIFDLNRIISIFTCDSTRKITIYFEHGHNLVLIYEKKEEMQKIHDILVTEMNAKVIEL